MSAVSALEVALVIAARKQERGLAALDRFTEASRIQVGHGRGRSLATLPPTGAGWNRV